MTYRQWSKLLFWKVGNHYADEKSDSGRRCCSREPWFRPAALSAGHSAEFASGNGARRQARRRRIGAERNARFIARQDSLVQSRNFQFPLRLRSSRRSPAEASRRSTTSTTYPPFSRPYRGGTRLTLRKLPESLRRGTHFQMRRDRKDYKEFQRLQMGRVISSRCGRREG
ncbi:MAG: hypothetical protein ACLR8Y_00040 [Alistipes indistinctus]